MTKKQTKKVEPMVFHSNLRKNECPCGEIVQSEMWYTWDYKKNAHGDLTVAAGFCNNCGNVFIAHYPFSLPPQKK